MVAPVYYAHVDNDHLREVVSNLVENAIKYTPQGDVIIDVRGDDTHVQVSVQDSGIGIPKEDIPHLFQKFYRVDNTDTREIGGTGLGLYLSRRLAELMGGQIKVESEYKKGSTFTLELPRTDHTEALRLMEVSATAEELAVSATPPAVPEPLQDFTPAVEPPQAVQPAIQVSQPPVVEAAAQVTQPQQMQPAPVTPQAPNIPLSQLEQNPASYAPVRPQIQIPVRGPDENRQP
jgi:anti-sigma regulatory factor (Ser/Thr protein kinase)